MSNRHVMPLLVSALWVVLPTTVASAGNESVTIYPPALPIRHPQNVVCYEVTGDVGSCGIQCEQIWITGSHTFHDHMSYVPPDPNFGDRMFIFPAEAVDNGPVTITVRVCFGNTVAVEDTVAATVDVRALYDVDASSGMWVRVWTGTEYADSLLFQGGRPIIPLTTSGAPHADSDGDGNPDNWPCDHDQEPDGHRFCVNGDTPPCQPWDPQDPTQEPVEYAMETCLRRQDGVWTHTQGYGHLDRSGQVTIVRGLGNHNMGHYYLTCPEIEAPCGCLRGEGGGIGIHGAGHLATMDQEMAVSQQITNTYGCIRIENGCPICAENHGLQALGDYHIDMQEGHNHSIYLRVAYPGP